MNVVLWLVFIGGAICLVVLAAGWLLGVMGVVLKGAADTAEVGATSVLDLLGKKRLMRLYEPPEDLLELEGKLATEDLERYQLIRYAPSVYEPGPLKDVKYIEELPKLFRREAAVVSTDINIEEVRGLTTLSPVPAFELLTVVNEEPPPKFPSFALPDPSPVSPPCEWTKWGCKENEYDILLPVYGGVLKPLNYFVQRSFKKAIDRVDSLRSRQALAREKALLRNAELERLYQEAMAKYEQAKQKQQVVCAAVQLQEKQQADAFFDSYNIEKQELERLVATAKLDTVEGLVARVEQSLKLESFPRFVPVEFAVRFDEASRILILEHEFPDVGSVRWIKLVSLKSGLTIKPANQKEAKDAAILLYPALCLRLACEIARLDPQNLLEAIVVNGWSNYTEKSTGKVKRAYCSSLFATKAQLLGINLSAADPLAAFAALKGIAARSLELTPIAPILRLNTEDSRFVDAKDVLANMAQGENLAAMDWEDFEHLCRQLFEKAFAGSGAEVKVTQASRDQGVDAVIFDPDVLRGGKIVVQAMGFLRQNNSQGVP